MQLVLALVLIAVPCAFGKVHNGDWHYGKSPGGPHTWKHVSATCGGKAQSPIDFTKAGTKCGEGEGRPKLMQGYTGGVAFGHAVHNGHTAQFNVPCSAGMGVKIGDEAYQILQFHFHWATCDGKGSEHTVNGKSYPSELHLVAKKFGFNKLAVLGFFIDITAHDNKHLLSFTDALSELEEPGLSSAFSVNISHVIDQPMRGHYFSYQGSLTTPPCSEIVLWTVYQTPIYMSTSQMKCFRAIPGLTDIYRPTQPINGRIVYDSSCPAV